MLSKEEKEALEQFKSWRKYIIKHKEETNKADDLEFYITIILNLIEKLQKENKKLKGKKQDLLKKLRNRVKEVKKLTKYSQYKKEFSRLNQIIKEKDNQIDLILKEQIEDGYLVNFHNLEEAREYYKRIAKEKGE